MARVGCNAKRVDDVGGDYFHRGALQHVRGVLSSVLLFAVLRWYFDYADGILARKYNQVTTFGDYYDHANDLIFIIVIFDLVRCKVQKVLVHSVFHLLALCLSEFGSNRLHRERVRRDGRKDA